MHARRTMWVLLTTLLLGCSPGGNGNSPEPVPNQSDPCLLVESGFGPPGEVGIRVEEVVSGLEVPWSVAFLPGGDLLVTERPGRVRRVSGGALVPDPVATIPTNAVGEGGLLGLALHPEFAQTNLFYVYVTTESAGVAQNRVERWRLSGDRASAQLDRVILEGLPAARVHDGGRIRFGPDGMLYVSVGDVTNPSSAQDPESRSGKLLRVTPDGDVPPDNPFPGNPAWLLGVRNSQGFDWRDANTIAVADHGPSGEFGRQGLDEVTLAQSGQNLGWPEILGCEAREGLLAPSIAWVDAVPPGGAAFYTGSEITAWQGSLLVGVLGAEHLQRVAFSEDGGAVTRNEVYLSGTYGRLRDVVMGPDGHLYLTTSNCDGRVECPSSGDRILRVRAQ